MPSQANRKERPVTEAAAGQEERRTCAHCGSLLTTVGAFRICPHHGQLPDEQVPAALRLFLSYGHDRNEELVRRIKADLEARGHDVWSSLRSHGMLHWDVGGAAGVEGPPGRVAQVQRGEWR